MTTIKRFDIPSDSDSADESPKTFRKYASKKPPTKSGKNWDLDSDSDEEVQNLRWESKVNEKAPGRLQSGFTSARSSWQEAAPPRGNEIPKEQVRRNSTFDDNVDNDERQARLHQKSRSGSKRIDERENIHSNTQTSSTSFSGPVATVKFERGVENRIRRENNNKLTCRGDEKSDDSESGDYDEEEGEEEEEQIGRNRVKEPTTTKFSSSSSVEAEGVTAKDLQLGDGRRSGRYEDTVPASRAVEGSFLESSSVFSYTMIAHSSTASREHVQCTIIRDRSTMASRLYPTYELILEGSGKVLIVGKKMNMNTTSNYHLFDMTRGTPGSKLTKKSANYMGKLRAQNSARTEYVVVTSALNKEEMVGITFERQGMVKHLKDGSQPRKMIVVLPGLDSNNVPIPRTGSSDSCILDELESGPLGDKVGDRFRRFHSKDPVFENGNYRLNFKGRVTTPSVKNFQLVPEEDIDDILCQFGKVGDDRFHLDFKSPLNAFQAFCLALAQFNL